MGEVVVDVVDVDVVGGILVVDVVEGGVVVVRGRVDGREVEVIRGGRVGRNLGLFTRVGSHVEAPQRMSLFLSPKMNESSSRVKLVQHSPGKTKQQHTVYPRWAVHLSGSFLEWTRRQYL